MSAKYVLAIDAGSSACRTLISDLNGLPVSYAHQKWTYDTPADVGALARQFDAAAFWRIICELIRRAVTQSAIDPEDIIAVSAASQRQGVVFLDKNGVELYAGPNTDLRALVEGFSIDSELGHRIPHITGHSPSFMFTPAKLRWFKTNRPDIYERIETVLTINSWITYRLCGRLTAELSGDADAGMIDVCGSCWSRELTDLFEVPIKFCPELLPSGTCVGNISRSAAQETGLTPNTLVAVGGGDTQCGLLGMGLGEQGQVGIVAGWSGSVQMVLDKPLVDLRGNIWTGCHVLPSKWVLESNASECGGAYAWLKEILFGFSSAPDDAYAIMDSLALEAPRGAAGVLAFLGPRVMQMTRLRPYSGGFILPITPTITNLERKHLIRAGIENLCFALKANSAQLEEVSQVNILKVGIGGGLARSPVLVQMVSDVLQKTLICFDNSEVTSFGVAMCAATAAGIYPDLHTAMEAMQPKSVVVKPDMSAAGEYAVHYRRWTLTTEWLDELVEKAM